MKRFTKLASAAALCALGASAYADPFYIDAGSRANLADVDATNCATCTSDKDQWTMKYQSSSVVTDLDGNGVDAGDKIVTQAGLAAGGGIARNALTGLNPGGLGSGYPDAGFGTNWGMTFSVSNLTGSIATVIGGVPYLSYGPGAVLHMYFYYDAASIANPINFMDVNITGGATDGTGTGLAGTVDFTNITAGNIAAFGNLFHSASVSCNGSSGFYDIWKNCGMGATPPIELAFGFLAHFDTDVFVTDFESLGNNLYSITSNHDGSATFAIPEPTSVALVGLAMIAGSAIRRRKQQLDA